MKMRTSTFGLLTLAAVALSALSPRVAAQAPVTLNSARVKISGTSNIHAYTASTTTVHVTRAEWAGRGEGSASWTQAMTSGGVQTFEITIPAVTLTSPKEGLDKNMHKALAVSKHPDILFRLIRLEPRTGAEGAMRGVGVLTVAGVERQIAIDMTATPAGSALKVEGQVAFLMTDFGITPPVAMLGMLKTDPKVTVTFETVLATH